MQGERFGRKVPSGGGGRGGGGAILLRPRWLPATGTFHNPKNEKREKKEKKEKKEPLFWQRIESSQRYLFPVRFISVCLRRVCSSLWLLSCTECEAGDWARGSGGCGGVGVGWVDYAVCFKGSIWPVRLCHSNDTEMVANIFNRLFINFKRLISSWRTQRTSALFSPVF